MICGIDLIEVKVAIKISNVLQSYDDISLSMSMCEKI